MSSPKIKGSDLLVKALENEGVERIYGVPGEENLDVVESLRGSKIDLVITRHEQAAAFMAAAESYGATGSQVDSADGLAPVLEAAFNGGGVHLVAVSVDYSENIRVLVEELRRAVPAGGSS
jgi:thiamine pyrophosphate-dependent acetolactate synthase large subunit-like protein